MELRIPVAELARAVSLTQGIVQRKNTMPILGHLLLDVQVGDDGAHRLTLSATDLDVSVRTERACEVVQPGAVTIPARALADMVRVLPGPDVSLKRLANHHVEVKSGRTKARLLALSPDEFPALPPVHDASFMNLESALLLDMIDKTIYAASTDETRYNLNGVYFEMMAAEGGGSPRLVLVATDGHRLVRIERTVDGLDSKLKSPVILSRKGLGELRRILEAEEPTAPIQIGFKENQAIVKRGNTLLTMRLIDGQFPDYKQVIPRLTDKIVRVSRSDLIESLKRVNVLAADKMQPIRLALSKDQLVVSCTNVDTGEMSDDVPVEYSGQSVEIAFNARYLIEGLASLDDKNVLLKLTDNLSPGLIVGTDEARHLCVVMPMRL